MPKSSINATLAAISNYAGSNREYCMNFDNIEEVALMAQWKALTAHDQ